MSLLKKAVKWSAVAMGVIVAAGLIIGVVDPEGTKKRAEERKRQKAENAAQKDDKPGKNAPPGFAFGFMAGSLCRSKGMKKPTADEVDSFARKSANESNVPHDRRSFFVGNYTQAFWIGWNRAK
jgi:heme exporter protein D